LGVVFAVARPWAQSHRDRLVSFLRAWLAGLRWANDPANHEEALKLIAAGQKLSQQALAAQLAELSRDGALNLAGLKSVLDLRIQFDFTLPLGTALERYYDLDYYRAARNPG
jgi:ABC-type nitrate/sulfonate/bicarbonate transport system substrate-binding protein